MTAPLHCLRLIFALIAPLAVLCIPINATHAQSDNADVFARCRTISNDAARLRCFKGAVDAQAPSAQGGQAVGPWRLMRSRDPRGGADAVAIMRTADLMQSDLGFAGLMFRCGDRNIEVVVVTTEPFPPRAQPRVKILAGKDEVQFDAAVVPPFSALLLPPETAGLADGPWQSLPHLSIEIDHNDATIHGTVGLEGLGSALAALRANCSAR
jgi:hypothetical protein